MNYVFVNKKDVITYHDDPIFPFCRLLVRENRLELRFVEIL